MKRPQAGAGGDEPLVKLLLLCLRMAPGVVRSKCLRLCRWLTA